MDFCSKQSYCPDGTPATFCFVRDMKKVLNLKQYYTGNHPLLKTYPYLQPYLILSGLKHEKASKLLEDIVEHRVNLLWRNAQKTKM
jgi:hypothetical protein